MASERVAAALAQVEEVRRTVAATNSALSAQLRGAGGVSEAAASITPLLPPSAGQLRGPPPASAAAAAAPNAAAPGAGGGAPGRGGMPTVGAATVLPAGEGAVQQSDGVTRGGSDALVRDGLLALAALAASVQQVDTE